MQQLKDEQAQRMERFIQMLQSMVVKQGQRSNLTLFGMDLYVTPEQSRQAAESIAEGGEYSVDAVAGRIMDMAKALSGGDPSKIDTLRTAVQKGFQAAGVELGGEAFHSLLPRRWGSRKHRALLPAQRNNRISFRAETKEDCRAMAVLFHENSPVRPTGEFCV